MCSRTSIVRNIEASDILFSQWRSIVRPINPNSFNRLWFGRVKSVFRLRRRLEFWLWSVTGSFTSFGRLPGQFWRPDSFSWFRWFLKIPRSFRRIKQWWRFLCRLWRIDGGFRTQNEFRFGWLRNHRRTWRELDQRFCWILQFIINGRHRNRLCLVIQLFH